MIGKRRLAAGSSRTPLHHVAHVRVDIFALIKDHRLPDEIRARVLPGLFRMAVESAAQQAYYTKQSLAGRPRAESEQEWMSVKKTVARLALAVHGDPTADLKGWLDAKPERRRDSAPVQRCARRSRRRLHAGGARARTDRRNRAGAAMSAVELLGQAQQILATRSTPKPPPGHTSVPRGRPGPRQGSSSAPL